MNPRHAARWTTDEDNRLRELWMRGDTRQRIADALGRYLQAVDKRRRHLRLPAREVHRPGGLAFSESIGAHPSSFRSLLERLP